MKRKKSRKLEVDPLEPMDRESVIPLGKLVGLLIFYGIFFDKAKKNMDLEEGKRKTLDELHQELCTEIKRHSSEVRRMIEEYHNQKKK